MPGTNSAHDGARASRIAIAPRDDAAVAEAGLHSGELFEFEDVLLTIRQLSVADAKRIFLSELQHSLQVLNLMLMPTMLCSR